MRRDPSAAVADEGVRFVETVVEDQLLWLFREQPTKDYGVDAHMEIVASDDRVTGRLIGLQIKSGKSWFDEPVSEGWVFRSNSNHLAYWLGHSLPILVVMFDPASQTAYWQVISPKTVTETERGFKVTVPRIQVLDSDAREALLTLASIGADSLDAKRCFGVLPSDAVGPLKRAVQVDELAAARLAERLASGRARAGITASSVVGAKPSWLTGSTAAQELWMAVGGYASEHGEDLQAAQAFCLAAESPGPIAARARAFAGLSLLFIDREAARRHLHRARDEGQVLLADIGLPYLDVPEGDARAFEVPRSMRDASEAELNAEPSVLNFLGELALRRGELHEAVAYHNRAVEFGGESSSKMRLALASTLWRRAASEGGRSTADLRKAVGHAQAAVEERRRWDGPSAEALAVLVDILTTSFNTSEALRVALPVSEGGTASEAEAMNEEVARRGAMAALTSRDGRALEFFRQALPEGPSRNEVHTLERLVNGESGVDTVEVWTSLLAEASGDAMALRCISRLVSLGVWPPKLDELLRRSIIPADTAAQLRALHRATSEDLELGLAELRDLATQDPHAAFELVGFLERRVSADVALVDSERAVKRWGDPLLITQLADLLRRHGLVERAAALFEQCVTDDAIAVDVRLTMCQWYVEHKANARAYVEAVAMARSGLALTEDPDLAWNLVAALYNSGKITQAREALVRYGLEPATQLEIRLWMQLHLGTAITSRDATIMVDLARRQPNGALRDGIISHLVREVLYAREDGGSSYTHQTVDAVALLAAEIGPDSKGGLRLAGTSDDELRLALSKDQMDPARFQDLIQQVRRGILSVAELAEAVGRPYGAALLQRPSGFLYASDLRQGLRAAGERAAVDAIEGGSCVIDLSSVHVYNLIPRADQLRLTSAIPEVAIARAAVADAANTRITMRTQVAATVTASLQPDGTIKRTVLTPTQQAMLAEQAEALETKASSFQSHLAIADNHSAYEDTLDLAEQRHVPLWCDDAALRQKARARNISSFCLLDLISALSTRGTPVGKTAILDQLAEQYVVHLPLEAGDIARIAASHDWAPGPAHTAISRPEWWQNHDADWPTTWFDIAVASRPHSAAALIDITKGALTGAIEHVTEGRRTQRYQQIAALALAACYKVGQNAPDNFLDTLAEHATTGLAPNPSHVLVALMDELRRLGCADPLDVARQLLPGAELP